MHDSSVSAACEMRFASLDSIARFAHASLSLECRCARPRSVDDEANPNGSTRYRTRYALFQYRVQKMLLDDLFGVPEDDPKKRLRGSKIGNVFAHGGT